MFIKGLLAIVPLVGSILVAFVKIASRPLEEWAAIGIFYFLTPKVYLYMPLEEPTEEESSINLSQYQLSKSGDGEDEEF
jgi:hypothetical protein